MFETSRLRDHDAGRGERLLYAFEPVMKSEYGGFAIGFDGAFEVCDGGVEIAWRIRTRRTRRTRAIHADHVFESRCAIDISM